MAAAHKMAAARRRRLLPAWMEAAGEGERRAGGPGRVGRRRRQKAAAEPRAATVYCMNEAELVDVALGVLAESLQRKGAEEEACSGSQEEQDLHQQVEQELQAAPSQAPEGTASMKEGSHHSPGPPSSSGAGTGAERTGLDDSDDDALKYVREIFFT
ncbi:cell cycle regulator of non-homologous end joining [Centrocercus urophasianus]|uniref:cell cycle regulator of non-homologous end joining n=1 Tax=Centrocercus urophasianus TaxID=9002 RepID=UPI001C64F64E|nr:cell cycle regulator of non-homologous end joining [Centrocercus urophasianus]